MVILKDVNTEFWSTDSDDNNSDSEEENLPTNTSEEDNATIKGLENMSIHSDLEEDYLSTKTSDDDSSWVRIEDHDIDSDFQEDLSAKTSDGESSWVNIRDPNVDSEFQEDHFTDYYSEEDVPLESPSLKRNAPATELDTQFSQILDLKEDKSHVEYSYAEGPIHSCNSDPQSSKVLKCYKDDEDLKDLIKIRAKSPVKRSYAEGPTHSYNSDIQSSKKLKYLKADKSLEELIKMHALPFLPAKSLCRFRSVCKDWDKWISNPFLAHEQTNKFKDISGLLCQSPSLSSRLVLFNRDAYGIPNPSFSFLPDLVKVKSTCNGLVCCQCSLETNDYYICNPVTQKWTKLPKPNKPHEAQTVATLAFEPSLFNFAPHYQLVCAVVDYFSDCPAVYFEIYSSRTNTWRFSEMECYDADALTLSSDGFYMKDYVYWKTLSGAVLTFHLKDETYSILQLPPNHGPQGALSHLLGELCYILPVIQDHKCIISIYGDMAMNLKYEITLPRKISGVYCQALPSPNDEMLIILLEEEVIAYHVRAEKVEILSKVRIQGFQTVLPYINTLVGIATPLPELETVVY